jgi:signal transduction histidine kinase/CheY-like chemotaxis protein
MLEVKLLRIGQILGSLALAVLLAWLSLSYNSRSKLVDINPAGVRLLRIGLLKVEPSTLTTPEQMLARQDWIPLRQSGPVGWSTKIFWARVELENTTPFLRDVLLEVAPPRLTNVSLHQRTSSGQWRTDVSGMSVAAKDRPLNVPDIVFAVQLQPLEKRVVLVQAQSNTTALNMAFVLHDPSAFAGRAVQASLVDLMLIGATLALGMICLCIGIALRQSLQMLLGLRSLLLGTWLLLQLGFLSLLLPSTVVAVLAQQTVWIAWWVLALTTGFVWLYLSRLSALGLPKWAHRGFCLLVVLFGLSGLAALTGLQHSTQLAPQIGQLNIAMTIFTLLLSAWMVWRGQAAAAMIVVTSCSALLINFRVHLSILGINNSDILRQLISPIPVLITSAVFFVGITLQLLRERKAQQAILLQTQQQAMALLEDKVTQRTHALEAARDEAHQANAAKSLFMAKVSHELRTPMHAVLGYVGLVLRDEPADTVSRRLKAAQKAGQHLVSQIDNLLDYARIDHEQMRLAHTVFSLPALLKSVSERAMLLAAEHDNRFTSGLSAQDANGMAATDCAQRPLWLLGDPTHIEQVLLVLLNNAMRYTQHGSVALHIHLVQPLEPQESLDSPAASQPRKAQRVRFTVTDTGRGISPEALARIFVPFERGAATDQNGLGLGLPIAKHLLALMHSHLEVQSQPNQGSAFSFTLTLPQTDETLAPPEPVTRPMVGYIGPTLRILLLEDNAASRQYLHELLGDMGFDVCAVASVAQAQEAVSSSYSNGHFDLFIVDQHLGEGSSGWDFVKLLRTSPAWAAACSTYSVLMLSATEARVPVDWGDLRGIDMHVLKPVSEPVIVQALTALLKPQWIEREANTAHIEIAKHLEMPPEIETEYWSALEHAAKTGCITALNDWCVQHPTLLARHPALAPMIAQLNFLPLQRYALELAHEVNSG